MIGVTLHAGLVPAISTLDRCPPAKKGPKTPTFGSETMTQVAATAGLARPTVYLHFATKLDLLTACIDAAPSDVPVRDRPDYLTMGRGALPDPVHRGTLATTGSSALRAHPADP